MPDKDIQGLNFQDFYTGPDGNGSIHPVTLEITAAKGDGTLAANDRFYLAKIPRGTLVHSLDMVVHTAPGQAATMRLGTRQRDSAGDTGEWTDDDDYFVGDTAVNARKRVACIFAPLKVDEPNVFLTARVDGASISSATAITFIIGYVYEGNL